MAAASKSRDPRLQLLPGQLRPVAELAGFDAVERLLVRLGGRRFYVPKKGRGSKLARACGDAVADAMAKIYGGRMFVCPVGEHLDTARKHEAIRNDPRDANRIAADWKMHVDSIYRIRGARRSPDPRQIDLEDWLRARPRDAA